VRAILNFLWFVLGGVFMGLAWWLVGFIAYITIIGIPWGRACFVMGNFSFFPFGKEAISRRELNQADDIGTGALGTIGNVIWFIFAGVWLALGPRRVGHRQLRHPHRHSLRRPAPEARGNRAGAYRQDGCHQGSRGRRAQRDRKRDRRWIEARELTAARVRNSSLPRLPPRKFDPSQLPR
jgi:hypothetical protein